MAVLDELFVKILLSKSVWKSNSYQRVQMIDILLKYIILLYEFLDDLDAQSDVDTKKPVK